MPDYTRISAPGEARREGKLPRRSARRTAVLPFRSENAPCKLKYFYGILNYFGKLTKKRGKIRLIIH